MKKSILSMILILGILAISISCTHRNEIGRCGENIVYSNDRYKMVLAKCGEPDDVKIYESEFWGTRIGTRLMYGAEYLYYDRWGLFAKAEPVPALSAFDALPYRASGQTMGSCRGDIIITLGNRLEDVLLKCGEPADYADFTDFNIFFKSA